MKLKNTELFIEPKELIKKINDDPNFQYKILDATFYLPDSGLDAEKEFNEEHIKNSAFFDINKIAASENSLPHMIPSKNEFSSMMQKLGVNKDDVIIFYDNSPFLSSSRGWFLFRYFGHNNILILKGGIKNWKNCNGAVSNEKINPVQGDFEANMERKELVVNLDQMISESKNNSKLILDARSEKRYLGEAKEPRPELPSGHIPNSKSLPASDLISSNGYLKSLEELNEYFLNKNINKKNDIIATCGSGVSACVISIALYCLGKEDVPIYDGSWTEWASSGQEIKTSV